MGRPEPCVLYAHSFVHPHLDEYVDEVLFSEPVVIAACEFLEQTTSSVCPSVKLIGGTSPPSFALEVFVHCEGEPRFRRLCLPFLYSPSSSNVLEIEDVVTNHLVVRGSYRSLSMVIYGNRAEDLGQFNIDVDIEGSLTETVSVVEGNLEDLPPALRSTNLTIQDPVSPLGILSQAIFLSDLSVELRKFLGIAFRILDSEDSIAADKVVNSLSFVASVHVLPSSSDRATDTDQSGVEKPLDNGNGHRILGEIVVELSDLYMQIQNQSGCPSIESSSEGMPLDLATDVPSSKYLMDVLCQRFDFVKSTGNVGYPHLSQSKNTICWLNVARLLCSTRESCFNFVNNGGMKQLGYIFAHQSLNSTAVKLLLLGVIELATRQSIGCEGFLGWWPREDDTVPSGRSDGYNHLLKFLLDSQRHDIASLATYILHRLRFYEVACRFEAAALTILQGVSSPTIKSFTYDILACAKMQLKKLLKLITLSAPIDDPSPTAAAKRLFILGDAGSLSYKATRGLLNLSNCSFSKGAIDSHLLSILKERGFLPLSAALLSSSILRSETGNSVDLLLEVVSHVSEIIVSLLLSRAGLSYLLHDPEVLLTVIHALQGSENVQVEDPVSVRYAMVLMSKGIFCQTKAIGSIVQMHMRALNIIDRLLQSAPSSDEFLWVLWDLCRLSRSECGRQALLVLVNFPEALELLLTALHSGTASDPVSLSIGRSPLDLAIFHSVAEIFELIVSDSTATSLTAWMDHAKELHTALHSSSTGSNRKDAPARLLEWIDGGVVYHKKGALGLLRYAAVLASGGDAHMASNSVLSSDMMDVDNVVGDLSSASDGSVVDSLIGKRITEKDFPGIVLRDSSIIQLTTAFRILAFISDNSVVAAALYDEGAVMVIHAVLINCKLMLERSSNIYDYLVDEGTEGNSTTDFLLERNKEKGLFDLLIPSLVLLINLLHNLQEANEQHRNTKLMNALLQLHREVSPKLAASASELSNSCPQLALNLESVCHLLASALACWPLYSWTPSLFNFFLDSLHTTTLFALGPKETCSLFCLLNDLLPDEGIWMWKNEVPLLSGLRGLALGAILGPEQEKLINWYLKPGHSEKLAAQLSPHMSKLADLVLHCAISMSVVTQDVVRVFIIRFACLNMDNASLLLRPIISWILNQLSESSMLSNMENYKVYRLLNFLGILMEHPNAKPLFLKENGFPMLIKVLERCVEATNVGPENLNASNTVFSPVSWCIPAFKSISLLCDGRLSRKHSGYSNRNIPYHLTPEEHTLIWSRLFKLCMVLPFGRELHCCLSAFKEIVSHAESQNALLSIYMNTRSSAEVGEPLWKHDNDAKRNIIDASEWRNHPPLLCCWTTLLRSIDLRSSVVSDVTEAIDALSAGVLSFCMDGKSLNMERVAPVKFLFGVESDDSLERFIEESTKQIDELNNLLKSQARDVAENDTLPSDSQVNETARWFLLLLQNPSALEEDAASTSVTSILAPPTSSRIRIIAGRTVERIEDSCTDEFEAKFSWECPETLRDRLTQTTNLPLKRKISSVDGPNRQSRGEILVPETTTQSASFSRGAAPVTTTPSGGPTRRDTFRQRSASGRPPSIHVDEFMAREKERHNVVVGVPGNDAPHVKATSPADTTRHMERSSRSQALKSDLDDDLQIDIVFDAEESEPDDKLPFPQPDDNLQQPSSVVLKRNSPHSVVEETESDANDSSSQFPRFGTPLGSNIDENTTSEFSSRISGSRPDTRLTREPSISSDKKVHAPLDERSFTGRTLSTMDSFGMASGPGSGVPGSVFASMAQASEHVDPRVSANLYSKASPSPQGFYNQRYPPSQQQPPLPPMPPPQTVSAIQTPMESISVQSGYASIGGNSSLSSPGRSARPPPPLPPTPPPYSALSKSSPSQPPQHFQTVNNSQLQQNNAAPAMLGSYPMPSVMQPMLFRPSNAYGNSLVSHPGENLLSVPQNVPISQPSVQTIPTHTQLQPLQPSQFLHSQHHHHLRTPVSALQYSDHGTSLVQSSPQGPAQTLHTNQQPLATPPSRQYYQVPQQENSPRLLQQPNVDQLQQVSGSSVHGSSQQQDPAISLQEYFKSPEAIQSLLSDRDKLCQLLEQHPKLMELLQERLGKS